MRKIVLIIDLMLLWLLLTCTVNYQSLIIGLSTSVIIALVLGNKYTRHPVKWLSPKRYFWLIVCYIPIFTWDCLKANFDVAYRVLHPKMPIAPGIVRVKTRLKSRIGRTVLANSITMTPGTLSVDIDAEYLYIHWIKVWAQDEKTATEMIVGKYEKLLIKIFE